MDERSWEAECKAHRETMFQIAEVLGMRPEREADGTVLMPCGSDLVAVLREELEKRAGLETWRFAVENKTRAEKAEEQLSAIAVYARSLGEATGDWSVASPILEIISGDY